MTDIQVFRLAGRLTVGLGLGGGGAEKNPGWDEEEVVPKKILDKEFDMPNMGSRCTICTIGTVRTEEAWR
jgi:hypothetical protein